MVVRECARGRERGRFKGPAGLKKAQTHGFLSVFNSSQKHVGHMVSRPGGHGTSVVSDSKTKSVCCYGTALFLHYSDVINLQPCKSLIGTHGLHCRELTIQIYVEDDKKMFYS